MALRREACDCKVKAVPVRELPALLVPNAAPLPPPPLLRRLPALLQPPALPYRRAPPVPPPRAPLLPLKPPEPPEPPPLRLPSKPELPRGMV